MGKGKSSVGKSGTFSVQSELSDEIEEEKLVFGVMVPWRAQQSKRSLGYSLKTATT